MNVIGHFGTDEFRNESYVGLFMASFFKSDYDNG